MKQLRETTMYIVFQLIPISLDVVPQMKIKCVFGEQNVRCDFPISAPSPPTFDIIDVGDNHVNVTWEPSTTGNPGSVFFVQYRMRGKDATWSNSTCNLAFV